MNGFGAVTASVGVLCLVGALLIATVGKMQWPRATVALVLTGVTGILNASIGPTIREGVNAADSKIGAFIGEWTGTVVTGVIAAVVLVVAGFWVYQRRINMRTLGMVALIPPTITLIPGALGTFATTAIGIVPALVGSIVAFAFGLG